MSLRPANNSPIIIMLISLLLITTWDQRAALQSRPKSAKGYFNRAQAYRYQGHFCQAIRDYTAAIKIRDTFAKALRGRGIARYAIGDPDVAIEDLTRSISRKPSVQAYFYRSLAYVAQGNASKAKLDIQTALQRSPLNPVVQELHRTLFN